jgi:polyhydroxybutyrate depolymerase
MVPLFHGLGGSAEQQELASNLVPLAESARFILVTPDGTGYPKGWKVYGALLPGLVDDYAFVDDLIDEVTASVCVDPSRIYAAGMSNGATLAAQLGCNNSRIAAVAAVAGAIYPTAMCQDAGPEPIIAFHGTSDFVVGFNGSFGYQLGLGDQPVRDSMRAWAQPNGCNLTLQTRPIAADVTLEQYTHCAQGANVQLYVIQGGGHTWPGGDHEPILLGATTQSIEASQLIWSFFAAH